MFGGLSLTDVFAGTHACGLTTDGDTYCLGSPISGGVGGTPTLLGGGLKFVAIAGGTDHDCGVTAGGEAYCWGQNYSGQLGAGSRTPQEPTPLPVQGGLRFSTISVGNLITCGVTLQHEGYCWTGDSNNRGYSMPTLVPGGLSFTTIEVSHGNGGHVCGATTAGALYCWGNSDWWGNNLRGQLGTGAAARETYRTPPMPVVGGLVVGQQARR
jgi:alpha-tubulin suppressor-like RCC1 family protein